MTTDYSKMSDFEINKRVLEVKSGLKALSYAHNVDKRSAGIVDFNDNYHWFDFCNSWADAGNILERNFITITPLVDINMWEAFSPFKVGEFRAISKSPLHAAMIVFLRMNEDKE